MPQPPPLAAPQPQPQSQHNRINLSELKLHICTKLGPERSKQYFNYLNLYLCQKLSKQEFGKRCLSILGRENLPLHNQLIHSILKNALFAKTPPPQSVHEKPPSRNLTNYGKKASQGGEDELFQNSLPPPLPTVWCNGSRKVRSNHRERRIKDRPSPLGPNGQSHTLVPSNHDIKENGVLGPCDLKRPVRDYQNGPAEQLEKRPRLENSLLQDQASVLGKGRTEVGFIDDSKEAEQNNEWFSQRGPLKAPLGIPFCPASVGGARRSFPVMMPCTSTSSNADSGELCETEALRKRMERIAEAQGLSEVPMECANLLNHGLDAYLKRLIKSCVDVGGARSSSKLPKYPIHNQQHQMKPLNGVWPGNHTYVHNSQGSSISLQDFRLAMEMNPQQLGEDWPSLLEKIYFCSFEE